MPRFKYRLIGDKHKRAQHITKLKLVQLLAFFALILILHLLYTKSTYNPSGVYRTNISAFGAKNANAITTSGLAANVYAERTPPNLRASQLHPPKDYYVFTSQCRMPYVDPFTPEVRDIFDPEAYEDCAESESFITSIYSPNTQRYTLHLNTPIIEKYAKAKNSSAEDVSCCYRRIVRPESGDYIDERYSSFLCAMFHQNFLVPQHFDYIITECYMYSTKELLQQDAFSFVQYRNLADSSNTSISRVFSFIPKFLNFNTKPRKPSILMLGIDSLSRINLRRTMPKTFKYLKMNNWFELQGYNKMGDNTFPNLMALLTSFNESTVENKCHSSVVGGLDSPKCNLIWHNFRDFGYRTAYAEDGGGLSTFNYLKKGFTKPPTDYYLRPLTLAIEGNLNVVKKDGLPFCVGRKHYAEYIYDYALQFANVYRDEPIFGLFWANTFSHNSYDTPATMDDRMLEYLRTMERDGILNRAIVFFFSDHGMRFGPLVFLRDGFLEERLPMMFLSLPGWFRDEHPDFVKALRINRNRLTSPFDIYATLKEILEISDNVKRFPTVDDTTTGNSIFREVPETRTCIDAGITEHWCTCVAFKRLDGKDETVLNIANLIVDEMNKYLTEKQLDPICSELKLQRVVAAEVKLDEKRIQDVIPIYRILYVVEPEERNFQATVVYDATEGTISTNVEDITRLDLYAKTSKCTDNKQAKKYCICKDLNGTSSA